MSRAHFEGRSALELLTLYMQVGRELTEALAKSAVETRIYKAQVCAIAAMLLHDRMADIDADATQDLFLAFAHAKRGALRSGRGLENPQVIGAIKRLCSAAVRKGRE